MILGTAGHIDHGKTTLVRALTGVDTDRLPEEKRRGITIDLGFAPLLLDGMGTIGVVDVPGHEGFIRTMLAGASGIDMALLVIGADEGVMPQTKEHLEILSLLGITKGVVALTKSDLVDDEWLALVKDDVQLLLGGTSLEGSAVVPVSAATGAGMEALRNAILATALRVEPRTVSDDLFRMPVDRVFTVMGTGTVVTGTVWSGSVSRNASLFIRPGNRAARVRGVQKHGATVATAFAGGRAALSLAGFEVADIARGSVVVSDPGWLPTGQLEAEVIISPGAPPLTSRTRLRFHIGTSDVGCRLVGYFGNRAAGTRNPQPMRIVLDQPVIARGGDRFVLRYPSPPRTIGGGEVVDPYPARRKTAAAMRAAAHEVSGPGQPNGTAGFVWEADATDAADPAHAYESAAPGSARLRRMLSAAGMSGISLTSLPIRLGCPPSAVSANCTTVGAVTIDGRAYDRSCVDQICEDLFVAISVQVANHPLEEGVSLQTLRASFGTAAEVIDEALNRLAGTGRIELKSALARPSGWIPTLDTREQALSDAIMHDICVQPSEPPSVSELTGKFGSEAPALLRKLERDGELERVSDDRYYSMAAIAQVMDTLKSRLEPGRIYAPAELREVLGVSRKYLIPLLEFCDRAGITERSAGGRAIPR